MKKLISIFLTLALLVTLLPNWSPTTEAAVSPFSFNNEQYNPLAPRVVTTQHVDLSGTLNGVNGTSISYDVAQITYDSVKGETILNSNLNQTGNINVDDGRTIQVQGIMLFPGLNRITFKGIQGNGVVSDSIYIDYRNSPMLSNLQANVRGTVIDIKDSGTTVLYSQASAGKAYEDISLTGIAPNADKIDVIINGQSYTYSISDNLEWKFMAAPLRVKQGKNTLTIRVYNNNQSVETTRELAFYNGDVTFYDLDVYNGATKLGSLETSQEFSAPVGAALTVKGKIIVPRKKNADGTYSPDLPADWANAFLKYTLNNVTNDIAEPAAGNVVIEDEKLIMINFEAALGTVTASDIGVLQKLSFQGENYTKTPVTSDISTIYTYKLLDSSLPYIYDVKYLPGFTASTTQAQIAGLTGTEIEGATILALPLGIEVLVANATATDTVTVSKVTNSAGVSSANFEATEASKQMITRTINGVPTNLLRVVLNVSKLPAAGTQTLDFTVARGGNTVSKTISLLYGPYVKYDSMFDGMQIPFDTTMQGDRAAHFITLFNSMKGKLINIPNVDDIIYGSNVFIYVNNVEIPLKQGANKSEFMIDDRTWANVDDSNKHLNTNNDGIISYSELMYGSLNISGENKITFSFKSASNSYESTIKVTIIPTNLPQVPVPGTDGVYPYSVGRDTPLASDPAFKLQGTVFVTNEAIMNVYGTFDFIDLGERALNEADDSLRIKIQNKLDGLGPDKANYKIKISTPDDTDIVWTLNDKFSIEGTGLILNGGSGDNRINVVYNPSGQYFYFILKDQELSVDGSSSVYNITVFNSGDAGPRATYRLEVNPTSIPYTVLAPIIEKRVMNQNFIQVIITSPGAENVTINKQKARKMTYLNYSDLMPNGIDPTEIDAYTVTIKELKANKDTKIDLLITSGENEVKDSFTVKYVPENIPGAQIMDTMSSSHKLFDGQLNLTFPKGSNLIRTDYNVPEKFKNQVYSENDLLFAIANPFDGVIDYHEFETTRANYALDMFMGKNYFAQFTDRFIKVSSVFWIDGGLADDIITGDTYDPIRAGFDPYPVSYEKGLEQSAYFLRNPSRELMPSKGGTLTLGYDKNVTQSAGTTITVFRYDMYDKVWENIGGVVDEKKHTVKVPFRDFGYYVVAKLGTSFNDIIDHSYAREAMEAIYAKGVMNAIDPTGVFGADSRITRGEFVRMLVRATEIPLNYTGELHFLDAPAVTNISKDALYDYRYIETAARAGFIKGTRPKFFEPGNTITRQDAAVMMAKALSYKLETSPDKVRKTLDKTFKDAALFDYYAMPSVLAIQKKGFIQGSLIDANDPKKGAVFNPKANLLRGDAAIIIAKVMIDQKKLPKIYTK
ncbi:MAG: S-layer homology domain-containing protein [Candidatus Pristimantibacillus sp.]